VRRHRVESAFATIALLALAIGLLVGGRVQVMWATPTTGLPHVKDGKLRNFSHFNNAIEFAEATNTRFHLQLKLYPSGQIEVTYTTNVTMRTGGDCVVGVTPGRGSTRRPSRGSTSPLPRCPSSP